MRDFDDELGKLREPLNAANQAAHCTSPSHCIHYTQHTRYKGVDTPPCTSGEALADVIRVYIAEHRGRSWTDKTAETIEGCLKDFAEILGDIPTAAVLRTHLRQYKETLQKLPPNRTKKFPGVSIAALVVRPHPRTLSSTTIPRKPRDQQRHSRMPLVSPKGAEGAWIDEVQTDGKAALVEALAHAATTLEHYVLSTRVNNAKNERNELIEPFENPA